MKRDLLSIAKQWSSSGLTQKDFCSLHKISFNTLQYWLKQSRRVPKQVKGFVELVPEHRPSIAGIMELHFANGNRLVFHSKPDAVFIKSLIS
jgi:hypothetical protein